MNGYLFLLILGFCFLIPFLVAYFHYRPALSNLSQATPATTIQSFGVFNPRSEMRLIERLNALGGNSFLYLVDSELSPKIYTSRVEEALERAAKRGVEIKLICGPVIKMRNVTETRLIFKLAREGKISLYRAGRRLSEHFQIDGNLNLFVEECNLLLDGEERIGYDFPKNPFEAKPFISKFRKLIRSKEVEKIDLSLKSLENEFILLAEEEFPKFYHEVTVEKGKKYEDCDIGYLGSILLVPA